MKPAEFCQHHGFELVPELQNSGKYLINITDRDKRLFPTGIRKGTIPINQTRLEFWTEKVESELMDLILEKLYK